MAKTLIDFVKEAKAKITEVDVIEAKKLLDEGYKILDVREPSEFEAGHIEGSINVPRGVLESAAEISNKGGNNELQNGRDDNWLVVCRTSGRSAMAVDIMQQMGFSNVFDITGGMTAWEQAKLPIVK